MGLENQVALVTGAATEIGCAYVKYLLQNKVKVGKQKSTNQRRLLYILFFMFHNTNNNIIH